MAGQPSIAQMRCRCLDEHRRVLANLAAGRDPIADDGRAVTPGALRGYRTVLATLGRWGVIERTCHGIRLTDRGRELAVALEAA